MVYEWFTKGRRFSQTFIDRFVRSLVRDIVRYGFYRGGYAKRAFYRVFARDPDFVLSFASRRCPVCGFVGRSGFSLYQHVIKSAGCSGRIYGFVRGALEEDSFMSWFIDLVFPPDVIYYYVKPCVLSRLYGFYFDFMCSDRVHLNVYHHSRGFVLYTFDIERFASTVCGDVVGVFCRRGYGFDVSGRFDVAFELISKIFGEHVLKVVQGGSLQDVVEIGKYVPSIYVILKGALGVERFVRGVGGVQEGQ